MIVVVALSEAARPCRLQESAAAMSVEMRLLESHNVHRRLHPLNRLKSSLKLMPPWRSSLIGAWPRNFGHWARGILALKNKMATSWTAIRQSFFPHSLFARPQTFALHRKRQREHLNAGQRQVLKKIFEIKNRQFSEVTCDESRNVVLTHAPQNSLGKMLRSEASLIQLLTRRI